MDIVVTGIKVTSPGSQVNDVNGINASDINQDMDAIRQDVTGLNTCMTNQDVNSLNAADDNHNVSGINDMQVGENDCANTLVSVVDAAASTESPQITNSSSDMLSDLFFMCQPEKALYNMCKKDAMMRKPLVNVYRMDKDFIYTMSKSKPNWSDIDPYSSLEEVSSSDTIILETDKESGFKSGKTDETRYDLRERKSVEIIRNVNVRTEKEINYKESSDSNSDFVVKPKTKRNQKSWIKTAI